MNRLNYFVLCNAIDCPRNAECGRYIEKSKDNRTVVSNLTHICHERNKYEMFIRDGEGEC